VIVMKRAETWLGVSILVAAAACGQRAEPHDDVAPRASSTAVRAQSNPPSAPARIAGWTAVEHGAAGDAKRGASLVARYECNRCHEGTGLESPPITRHCTGCHVLVAAGKIPASSDAQREAMKNATHHFIGVPSLAGIGRTERASWIARFLQEPVKLRTHLEEWMPRLPIGEADARDIAAHLTASAPALVDEVTLGDASRGGAIFARRCVVCHDFTGAPRANVSPELPPLAGDRLATAIKNAPDLRFARERIRPDAIVAWIRDPSRVRADATMPSLGLSETDANDLAAFVLTAPLADADPKPATLVRLPILERAVRYEEVAARVFRKSCVHCHADPDASGDGGPGSTGGFGFAPRGVRLLSFAGTQLGYVADDGKRRSLFAAEPGLARWGGSRLVAAISARHEEIAGRPIANVRGMPMGLPALTPEEIQLVETWVAQGARRD
jgi:cytochrome c2